MSKIINGKCFDKDLNQEEDLEFYLMSSKDNIILEFEGKYYCYKRKTLTHQLLEEKYSYYGNEYYYFKDFGIFLNHHSYSSLSYRDYRFYSLYFIKNYKMGKIYDIEKIKFKNF